MNSLLTVTEELTLFSTDKLSFFLNACTSQIVASNLLKFLQHFYWKAYIYSQDMPFVNTSQYLKCIKKRGRSKENTILNRYKKEFSFL
jgi:hypothetical protein